jgi:hypothetical protein
MTMWMLYFIGYLALGVLYMAFVFPKRYEPDRLDLLLWPVAALIRKSLELSLRARRKRTQTPGEYVSILGIAPDFTDGMDSVQYIKERWKGGER